MINILPEQGRTRARFVYRLRLVAVLLWASAAVCLIAGALLSPAYFSARAEETAARAESAALGDGGEKGREAEAPLVTAATYLEVYTPLLAGASVGDRVALALSVRPAGIVFSQISYDRASDLVRVHGVASTREELLRFERALKALPDVLKVDLPVSDLARSTQAPFSVSIQFSSKSQ